MVDELQHCWSLTSKKISLYILREIQIHPLELLCSFTHILHKKNPWKFFALKSHKIECDKTQTQRQLIIKYQYLPPDVARLKRNPHTSHSLSHFQIMCGLTYMIKEGPRTRAWRTPMKRGGSRRVHPNSVSVTYTYI